MTVGAEEVGDLLALEVDDAASWPGAIGNAVSPRGGMISSETTKNGSSAGCCWLSPYTLMQLLLLVSRSRFLGPRIGALGARIVLGVAVPRKRRDAAVPSAEHIYRLAKVRNDLVDERIDLRQLRAHGAEHNVGAAGIGKLLQPADDVGVRAEHVTVAEVLEGAARAHRPQEGLALSGVGLLARLGAVK